MRNHFSKLVLAAGFGLALAFTFSCSGGGNAEVEKYGYCVFVQIGVCLEGPFDRCDEGGSLSNTCPFNSSNSAQVGSSSSKGEVSQPSSSSLAPSSSSTPQSSSSAVPNSSSSVVSSSSSVVQSSSSTLPSSSSSVAQSSSSSKASSSSVGQGDSSSSLNNNGSAGCDGFVNGTKREHYGKEKEQFCDSRDGTKYVYVKIGTQTWMAENLNYAAEGSKCHDNSNVNCATYGRLYDWSTAMGISSAYNSSLYNPSAGIKYQGVCPVGWHIPSNAEWNVLMKFVDPGCSDNNFCAGAGTKLKSSSGWSSYSGVPAGTDDFGFSALPGGGAGSDGRFSGAGYNGYWWSASEYNSDIAYERGMHYNLDYVYYYYGKSCLFSVRCLQD